MPDESFQKYLFFYCLMCRDQRVWLLQALMWYNDDFMAHNDTNRWWARLAACAVVVQSVVQLCYHIDLYAKVGLSM